MILTVPLRLKLDDAQKASLLTLLRRANAACAWVAQQAMDLKVFGWRPLKDRLYHEVRQRFDLPAQVATLVFSKVAGCFAGDKTKLPTFRPEGAFPFDTRLFSLFADKGELTLKGNEKERLRCGFGLHPSQLPLLALPHGESDVRCKKGKVYLDLTVTLPDEDATPAQRFLGVDLGVKNLATDSDGATYTGAAVERVRQKYARLRADLQAKGSRSARRSLKHISGKEARFRQIENHRIANRIVAAAQGTSRGIALEDLTGIRGRTTVRKGQRARHAGWAFAQLRVYLTYKAMVHRVPLVLVDPRNTSRECPRCHHIAKENRPVRDRFCCVRCGLEGEADHVAAVNISQKAEVNRLHVPRKVSVRKRRSAGSQAQSPSLQGGVSLRALPYRRAPHRKSRAQQRFYSRRAIVEARVA